MKGHTCFHGWETIGKKDGLFKIKISTEPETHIAHEIGS